MAKRKKDGGGGGGGGDWLATYADMVTLLFAFFAILLSMSTVDQEKFEQIIQSFQMETSESASVGLGEGAGQYETMMEPVEHGIETIDELYQYLVNYVNENQKQDAVTLSSLDNIVYIRFDTDLFFRPNQDILLPDSYPILQFIGEGLKGCQDIIQLVNISGHTADTNVENHISDWNLSGGRAATVADFLEKTVGFPPNKIKIEGYGDQYPIADNATEEGRRQNRRVELMIIGNDADLNNPQIYQNMQGLYNNNLYPTQGGAGDLLTPPTEGEPEAQQPATPPENAQNPAPEAGDEQTAPEQQPAPEAGGEQQPAPEQAPDAVPAEEGASE